MSSDLHRPGARVLALLAAFSAWGAVGCPASLQGSGVGDGGTRFDGQVARLDGPPLPHTLLSIVIAPDNDILQLDLNSPTTQAFTATGKYEDGVSDDLTAQVSWKSSNVQLGSFTGANLHIPGFATQSALTTDVTANLGSISGQARLTVVAYRQSGPKTDFFFILPYEDAAGLQKKPLEFSTDVRSLDVFFAVDTTASLEGEIGNLRTSLIADAGIVSQVEAQIADTQFGVGSMEDFPIEPYGFADCDRTTLYAADQPFRLFQPITSNITDVEIAISELTIPTAGPDAGVETIGCGGDWPEGQMEALYQIATGAGLSMPDAATYVAPNDAGIGGVAFRQGVMPVVVPITDVAFHTVGENKFCPAGSSLDYGPPVSQFAHNRQDTKDRLNAICAKVVGVAAMHTNADFCATPESDEEDFATATGARIPPAAWQGTNRPAACGDAGVCCTGAGGTGRAADSSGMCPLVFLTNTDGTGLGTNVATGLKMLTQFAPFDVDTSTSGELTGLEGETLPGGTTTANFIKAVAPASFQTPTSPPGLPDPTITASGFAGVTPGTTITFSVNAFNDFVAPGNDAQIFRATIHVTAGGCTELDDREVFILVPPKPLTVS